MKVLMLLLARRRRIPDTIWSQLFVGLLLMLGRRPRHDGPSEFFSHSTAFVLPGLFVRRALRTSAHPQ